MTELYELKKEIEILKIDNQKYKSKVSTLTVQNEILNEEIKTLKNDNKYKNNLCTCKKTDKLVVESAMFSDEKRGDIKLDISLHEISSFMLPKNQEKNIYRERMLEKFEYEQELKKVERENKLQKERLKKDELEKEIQIKKQLQEQENIKLERILTMFNSKNTETFTYGNFHTGNYGMNSNRNTHFTFTKIGEHDYIFSLDFLKNLINLNKDLLLQKYEKLAQDYIWIKKYVFGEGTNPFIEFIFDEFIPDMTNILEKNLEKIKQDDITVANVDRYSGKNWSGRSAYDNIHLKSQVKLINKIKETELKSKEYYITNYDDFCHDFCVPQINGYNTYDTYNGQKFNIYQCWVKTKQKMFNTLIDNIKDIDTSIKQNQDYNNIVNYKEETSGSYAPNNYTKKHILDIYNHVIQFSTQIKNMSQLNHQKSDLQSDYEAKYFEPLITLTKNIIELIEFVRSDIFE
jgi:hypothetical protein